MTAADRQRLREARDMAKRREIADAHTRVRVEVAGMDQAGWGDAPYRPKKPRKRP